MSDKSSECVIRKEKQFVKIKSQSYLEKTLLSRTDLVAHCLNEHRGSGLLDFSLAKSDKYPDSKSNS